MKKINSLQYCLTIYFPIISSILGTGSYVAFKISSISTPISGLLAIIMGLVYLICLLYIMNYNKDKNLPEIIDNLYGKAFGRIINYILVIIAIIIAATYFYATCLFISTQLLQRTPILVISFLLILIIYATVTKGYQSLSRVAEIIFFINIFLFIVPCIDLFPQIKIDNFKPFINNNFSNILKSSIVIFNISILPIYIIFSHKKNIVVDTKNYNKYIIISYLVTSLFMLALFIFTIGPLGEYLITIYRYPDYIVTEKVSFFNFIDRIENLITMQWVLGSTIYSCLILNYINNSIIKKTNISKILILASILIIIFICNMYFKNNFIYNNYISHIFPYICLVILPIIIITTLLIIIKKIFIKE